MKITLFLVLSLISINTWATGFTCRGTEPFWSIAVSNNKIVMATPENIKGMIYKGIAPKHARGHIPDQVSVYTTKSKTTEAPLTLIVTKNDACTDNMSDNKYNYSVVVIRLKEILYGCCVKS